MGFLVSAIIEGRQTRLHIELVYATDEIEHYKVSGRNKSIVLQTNRKLFRKKGLKRRKGTWKLIEGARSNTYALEKITAAIDAYLERDNQ